MKIKKNILNSDNVIITQHYATSFRECSIKYTDVISALNNGMIIEHYTNDYQNPSCLVLGTTLMQIEEMLDKCESNITEVAILNFNNSAA